MTQNNKQFTRVNWSILSRKIPIKAAANTCNLWLEEKLQILRSCNSRLSGVLFGVYRSDPNCRHILCYQYAW